MTDLDTLIAEAKALKGIVDRYARQTNADWVAFGRKLAEIRPHKPAQVPWPDFLWLHFQVDKSWANHLIRIATGKTTVEHIRDERNRSRARRKQGKHRPRQAIATDRPSVRKPKPPPENLTLAQQVNHLTRALDNFVQEWVETANNFAKKNGPLRPSTKEAHRTITALVLRAAAFNSHRLEKFAVELNDAENAKDRSGKNEVHIHRPPNGGNMAS